MLLFIATIEEPEIRSRLEKLYEAYEQEMHRQAFYVLHDENDAEDAVQNAFLGIWKSLDKLCDLGEKEIKWYVIRAAINAAIDIYRKKNEKRQKEEPYDENASYFHSENRNVNELGLFEKIAELPDRDRDVLMLKYVYGFQYKEMAKILGISTETVKKALLRAKNKLEKLCREEGLYND